MSLDLGTVRLGLSSCQSTDTGVGNSSPLHPDKGELHILGGAIMEPLSLYHRHGHFWRKLNFLILLPVGNNMTDLLNYLHGFCSVRTEKPQLAEPIID